MTEAAGMVSAATAYIGLGSNLEDPARQLQQALAALAQVTGITSVTCSPWYGSKAVGPGEQPDYINAVARLDTQLPPHDLLAAMQVIENAQGRQRQVRWGARTLDLDLLLYGDTVLQNDTLELPHPQMLLRNFVLLPLYDLTPDLLLPDGSALQTHVQNCSRDGIHKLDV